MVKLIWSPDAADDLENICNYIGRDSEFYAKQFGTSIVEIIEEIPDFPKMGRKVPEYNNESIREKIYRGYRIVYRVSDEIVEIASISHGSKLLDELEE